jgi:hypothetical protein
MTNLEKRRKARDIISWLKLVSKIGPFAVKPGRKGTLVDDVDFGDWRAQAKYAAQLFTRPNPEHFKAAIELAADIKHKQFFIDLGKCLSGDIDPELWDKRDIDIAEIVLSNPRISAKNAVRELEKRNHRGITEENFRNWKSKLLKAKREYDAFARNQDRLLRRERRSKRPPKT